MNSEKPVVPNKSPKVDSETPSPQARPSISYLERPSTLDVLRPLRAVKLACSMNPRVGHSDDVHARTAAIINTYGFEVIDPNDANTDVAILTIRATNVFYLAFNSGLAVLLEIYFSTVVPGHARSVGFDRSAFLYADRDTEFDDLIGREILAVLRLWRDSAGGD